VALLESLGGQQKRLKGKVTLNGVVLAAPATRTAALRLLTQRVDGPATRTQRRPRRELREAGGALPAVHGVTGAVQRHVEMPRTRPLPPGPHQ
jgi:hypothetical protein